MLYARWMMNLPQYSCDPLEWCSFPVWYLSVASLVFKLLNPYRNANDSATSSHVVRHGACQERGLLFCFWHKSQPLSRGRRESQGWLQASRWDDHDCGVLLTNAWASSGVVKIRWIFCLKNGIKPIIVMISIHKFSIVCYTVCVKFYLWVDFVL